MLTYMPIRDDSGRIVGRLSARDGRVKLNCPLGDEAYLVIGERFVTVEAGTEIVLAEASAGLSVLVLLGGRLLCWGSADGRDAAELLYALSLRNAAYIKRANDKAREEGKLQENADDREAKMDGLTVTACVNAGEDGTETETADEAAGVFECTAEEPADADGCEYEAVKGAEAHGNYERAVSETAESLAADSANMRMNAPNEAEISSHGVKPIETTMCDLNEDMSERTEGAFDEAEEGAGGTLYEPQPPVILRSEPNLVFTQNGNGCPADRITERTHWLEAVDALIKAGGAARDDESAEDYPPPLNKLYGQIPNPFPAIFPGVRWRRIDMGGRRAYEGVGVVSGENVRVTAVRAAGGVPFDFSRRIKTRSGVYALKIEPLRG
ncbi:MAG TPA: hypothetical protein PLM48_07380 [Clostridia bacterium]|nr:hypothetical protein [Clostridia bacterium]